MSMRVQIPMKRAVTQARSLKPARFGVMQRKCACGGSGSGGECADCKRERLQRSAAGNASEMAPPIVHEVLRSPGQPLDSATRAYFEPRFGHDFSKVRLHADAKAAESAQAVNALAYTVGDDIVFANRHSAPGATEGAHILAHELTHVLQQTSGIETRGGLRVGSIDSPSEREADQVANAVISNRPSTPTVHAGTPALQRQTPQTPTQTPAQTQTQPTWGSKKWSPFEDDWNAFYQLAVQGLAGSTKPEKLPKLAAMIADDSMVLCLKHGKQSKCAVAATDDQTSKSTLDFTLAWGSTGVWGQTFRSALQSTTSNVDGPITAGKAVQKAGDIADQAVRGMLGDALWKTYMDCMTPNEPKAQGSPPKAAASGGH
jgi:hypothetical protein